MIPKGSTRTGSGPVFSELSLSVGVTMATVHYMTPWLLRALLKSWVQFYPGVRYVVIDNSTSRVHREEAAKIVNKFGNGRIVHTIRNMGHGPGMVRALNHCGTPRVLFLDTDVRIVKPGYVEMLHGMLRNDQYGAGMVTYVNKDGISIPKDSKRAIPYLHPHFMMCNASCMKEWPLPIDHGAPMIVTMRNIHRRGMSHILVNLRGKRYYEHLWSGTVKRRRWAD